MFSYPKGSYKPSANPVGGTGFYATPVDLSSAKTVILEYKLFFPTGFNFVMGGKLPGLYGGHPSCSGGNDAKTCFSTRFMFRTNGDGEIYTYVDQSRQVREFCTIPPRTVCNPAFGVSVGRGSFKFRTGSWNLMRQEITLNTPGQPDGKVVVFVNGQKVIDFSRVMWRGDASIKFVGLDFETFFGGGTSQWATPIDQYSYYKDMSLTVRN